MALKWPQQIKEGKCVSAVKGVCDNGWETCSSGVFYTRILPILMENGKLVVICFQEGEGCSWRGEQGDDSPGTQNS